MKFARETAIVGIGKTEFSKNSATNAPHRMQFASADAGLDPRRTMEFVFSRENTEIEVARNGIPELTFSQ